MQSIRRERAFFVIGLIAIQLLQISSAADFSCLQCDSTNNAACLDPATAATKCAKDGITQCYTKNANGIITRGCYEDSTPACSKTDTDTCKVCDVQGCNNQVICKTCGTGDNDCSQTNASAVKYNAICAKSDTKCFMNVKDKKVERRCAADSDSCSDDTTCKICSGANCNAAIFPDKRRQCFQCSGADCDAIGSNSANSKPCLNYVADDKCYAIGTDAATMKRGCVSDESPCSAETDKACSTCGADGCNGFTYKRDPKMTCISCKTETEADCAAEHAADKATACNSQLLYNQTESCYTLTTGSKVQRGCLYDDAAVKQECDASQSCQVCSTSNGCNNKKIDIKFTCIVCRSDADKNCWNNAKKIGGKACRTATSSAEEGCFHGIWNDIAIRGCLVDADERMQVTCKDPKNHQCNLCHEKDCNTGDSGAGSIGMSLGLWLMTMTTFYYFK